MTDLTTTEELVRQETVNDLPGMSMAPTSSGEGLSSAPPGFLQRRRRNIDEESDTVAVEIGRRMRRAAPHVIPMKINNIGLHKPVKDCPRFIYTNG